MTSPADFTQILSTLAAHNVKFIVVGGISAVLNGAPVTTFDIDIVHDRSAENIRQLVAALEQLNTYYRTHPNQRIAPTAKQLAGPGHQLLMTDAGPLDVLGALGESKFDDLLKDSTLFEIHDLPSVYVLNLSRLISLKESTGREKDLAVLPVLRRTLEEQGRS